MFRLREHLGLQLTSIEYHFEHLQLVKCCLLENSADDKIKGIYALRASRVSDFKRRWAAPNELVKLHQVVEHDLRYAGQTGRAGLGSNRSDPYIAKPTVEQIREKITSSLHAQHEEKHLQHAACLVRQGVWTHWENVMPFDLSWENLIYGPGPRVIAFVLNAQINSVRTPDMLRLWGYTDSAACTLCGAVQCTLHHLLVNCKYALEQGRYTWRHDSVLKCMERALQELVTMFNGRAKPSVFAEVARKDFASSFVRAGQKNKVPRDKPQRGLLEYANDWVVQVDFKNCNLVFPPCICATNLRPDAVLWSMNSRTVILLELTCCAEEGVSAAQTRKEARYEELLEEIRATKTWTARLLTVEVGALFAWRELRPRVTNA